MRLGEESKKLLARLKTRTGISNWNVLCRWAFCLSMADDAPPRDTHDRGGNAVEMTWKTFAGEHEEIYRLMLVERCRQDHGRVERDLLASTLRLHLARGIARLAANRKLKTIGELISLTAFPVETEASG